MKTALIEIKGVLTQYQLIPLIGTYIEVYLENYDPDRVIIETSYVVPVCLVGDVHAHMLVSGSAFPATLAFQIRQLEQETNGGFKLDAIVTVIGEERGLLLRL